MQETMDKMWRRFTKEILPQYQSMQKWRGERRDLKEGDIVMLLASSRRGSWPVGRVVDVPVGRDGHAREAGVLLAGSDQPKRLSVVRLALLVPAEDSPKKQ